MNAQTDMDKCTDCGAWLPSEDSRPQGTPKTPCPACGSTRRIKSVAVHIEAKPQLSASVTLVISWQEVDRLVAEREYAAALLVAAVNVEFTLWENLHGFSKSASPNIQDGRIRSMWGQITSNHPEHIALSSLRKVAEHMSMHHGLVLVDLWRSAVDEIEKARDRIAHERGYFAELTRLEDHDWPESRIRRVLADAKAFCHGNGP